MFTQLEECVSRLIREGHQLLYSRTVISEDGEMSLRTVFVRDKNNGIEIWQSFLVDEKETVSRVYLSKQEIQALKLLLH
ncbi:hypothetical protein LOK74_11340 [Brevibacillus humidisoli]|uniref:hypothetical protein n=1 Tax=Brevibacillus humidisoli TaxID=2895522 RepID=UPI001E5190EF|nr:hypothetical protein [Brevibacillus humidisoli]UFJ43038.1 hypothetical protein LOK74_11340 [Brevibacillus humidisoli]